MRGRNFPRVPNYEIDAVSSLLWEVYSAGLVTGRVLWGIKAKGQSYRTANPTLGQENVSRNYSWGSGWRMMKARKNCVNATIANLTFAERLEKESGLNTT
jgi:hypothetical protein